MQRWRRSHRDPRPFIVYPIMACAAAFTALVIVSLTGERGGIDGPGVAMAAFMAAALVAGWRVTKADIYICARGVRIIHIISSAETIPWEHLVAVEVASDTLDRIVFRTVFGSLVYSDVYRCPPGRLLEVATDRTNAPRYTVLLGPKSFDRLVARLRELRDRATAT